MTVQINIRMSDEDAAEYDRWAAERDLERSAIVREILAEGLLARREGRAMFVAEKPALRPEDLTAMRTMMVNAIMEFERIATDVAKQKAELSKLERDDAAAMARVRGELFAGVPERITASLNPIRAEMDAMVERIENQPRLDAIDARQREHTEALKANTAAIERWAKEPRTQTMYNIGLGDWRGGMLASAWGILVIGAMGFYFALAAILPSRFLATPTGNRLLGGGDTGICRLVDYQYGTTACGVKVAGREVTVTAYVPRAVRGGGR
ncbi:hypothetical protein [Sphingomonas lenta]|uniref:Ribbon-helix-helix protein CopG domain-containing protein n=1 Tax=Sphingomonas lenta TaxID=1141887 RepID=A0A2A2SB01_9SPHN|nr:hypothetical protein [Sphingomonas lenta]PAX06393.1 hypothetical protein CKY28_17480 [Sphingomonas lenta]